MTFRVINAHYVACDTCGRTVGATVKDKMAHDCRGLAVPAWLAKARAKQAGHQPEPEPGHLPCEDNRLTFDIAAHSWAARDLDRAKALCRTCPILDQCRDDTLKAEEGKSRSDRHGVFGGLDPAERVALDATAAGRAPGNAGPVKEHGTQTGYNQHLRRGEPACAPCKAANTEATRASRTRRQGAA